MAIDPDVQVKLDEIFAELLRIRLDMEKLGAVYPDEVVEKYSDGTVTTYTRNISGTG